MLPYRILMHPESYQKADAYRLELAATNLMGAGLFLQRENCKAMIYQVSTPQLLLSTFSLPSYP